MASCSWTYSAIVLTSDMSCGVWWHPRQELESLIAVMLHTATTTVTTFTWLLNSPTFMYNFSTLYNENDIYFSLCSVSYSHYKIHCVSTYPHQLEWQGIQTHGGIQRKDYKNMVEFRARITKAILVKNKSTSVRLFLKIIIDTGQISG